MEEENPYSNYTASEVLSISLIKQILEIPSVEIREHLLVQLEAKAKELKIMKNLTRLEKNVQAEIQQNYKQKGSKETNFTKQALKLKVPSDYVCDDLGVRIIEFDVFTRQSNEKVVCSHPILPIERLINVDTNIEKVKLAFYKDKKWQYVIAEKNTLASKNKILQLANTGIEVNENNAKDLIIYLSSVLQMNTETIPLSNAITHLGWTEEGFVPYIKNFKFDGDKSFEGVFKDIKTKGDYELWKEKLVELRQSSQTLHFIVATSFASVLIEKLHINPFIVHLWGKSGTGKSVALIIAMSIWGNPKIGHLVKNLNSTSVGFERLSAFFNNIPFACDELQAIKNKYNNFNELIYTLTQGEGKSRGTIDGGIQEQLKWSCAFITNGEEPITLESSKEGVKNRVIEIEENNQIIENGNQVVNFLLDNYGFAGKEFIENLPSEDYLKEEHKKICDELKKKKPTTEKQINTIGTILLADKLASEFIFSDNALSIEQGIKYFTKDVDEAERIYNLILEWFFQNINKFYFEENIGIGEVWGKYKKNGEIISEIYIIPKVLKDFLLSNSINFDGIKNKLFDKGYIEKSKRGEYNSPARINGTLCRCIKIFVKSDKNEQQNNDIFPF